MQVYYDSKEPGFQRTVITVGIFDGLHIAHQRLLNHMDKEAERLNAPALVVTFWPPPKLFFNENNKEFRLLMSLDEKKSKMDELGVKHLLVLPFNEEMAETSAGDFIEKTLLRDLKMCRLILGDDHRFGKDRDGSYDLVTDLAKKNDFSFSRLATVLDHDVRVSSTLIRSCLSSGDLDMANKLLGYPYFIIGKVIKGSQLGRKIGFPTANLDCCDIQKQVPQDGVYAVMVNYDGTEYPGMLNIGTRPTVENYGRKSIEVHIFDIRKELYGIELKVSFIRRIRDEMKFENIEELKKRLIVDRDIAIKLLSR